MSISIVILAAGKGRRMQSSMPKVLQLLAGRTLLDHVLDSAMQIMAEDICIVYGHGGDAVKKQFKNKKLRWAEQAVQKGTGHAVNQAIPDIPDGNRVLILFGDVPLLEPQTIQNILDNCPKNDLAVLTVEMENPCGYGRIIRESGALVDIVEENDATELEKKIKEVNTGVLCCPAKKLKYWLSQLQDDNAQGEYYLTDVIKMASMQGVKVHGIKAKNQVEVMGINNKRDLAEVERAVQIKRINDLLDSGVTFADPSRVNIRGTLTCGQDVFIDGNVLFEGQIELGDNVTIGPNNVIRDCKIGTRTKIRSSCHIEGAVIGRGCVVGPFARLREGAVLSDKVKVGNFVEIKKSVIAEDSKINHLSYIGDASVGSGVNIGAGTITCNYDGAVKHQTVIGNEAFIGSGVELVAPVEVGASATIGAGTTLTKNAPPGKLTIERGNQKTISNWVKPEKKHD